MDRSRRRSGGGRKALKTFDLCIKEIGIVTTPTTPPLPPCPLQHKEIQEGLSCLDEKEKKRINKMIGRS